jgi:hypothetical protein
MSREDADLLEDFLDNASEFAGEEIGNTEEKS